MMMLKMFLFYFFILSHFNVILPVLFSNVMIIKGASVNVIQSRPSILVIFQKSDASFYYVNFFQRFFNVFTSMV